MRDSTCFSARAAVHTTNQLSFFVESDRDLRSLVIGARMHGQSQLPLATSQNAKFNFELDRYELLTARSLSCCNRSISNLSSSYSFILRERNRRVSSAFAVIPVGVSR